MRERQTNGPKTGNSALRGYPCWRASNRKGVDSWVRMRLRSILRKRAGGKGRGLDHYQWPNAYFAECGLYRLGAAHMRLNQSLTGP